MIVLVGAKIDAEFGEKFHRVTADFSRARASDDLEVTLLQVMQLTAECLQRNLERASVPIKIHWKAPPRQETLADKLPEEIKR